MSNGQVFSCNLSHSAEFSAEIIEWLRGKAPILIVTHDHPDPDARIYLF